MVSLSAVGNILVLAMLIAPAAAARLLTVRLPVMMGLSAMAPGRASSGSSFPIITTSRQGGIIVLVAILAFGVVWLGTPTHGFVATRLWERRRAAGMRSEEPMRPNRSTVRGDPRTIGDPHEGHPAPCRMDWLTW